MTRVFGLMVAAAMVVALPAAAAPQPERIRGSIESVGPNSITVQTREGRTLDIAVTGATKYVTVVKSSLSNVEKGSFVGTATKGSGDFQVALEVVIFPPSMRGTGEGHYAWDELPDTTRAGGVRVSSSMTNGTVESASAMGDAMGNGAMVSTSMTNGDVQSASDEGGAKRLTVNYNGGQQTILVPPTAPIVAFEPADRAAAQAGTHVFIRALADNGALTADFVAVGEDGVIPPM